jgi:hypothetical protein
VVVPACLVDRLEVSQRDPRADRLGLVDQCELVGGLRRRRNQKREYQRVP